MARRSRTLVGENVLVTVNLPSVAANATTVVTLAVPGAKLSRTAHAMPGPLFGASGLALLHAYPSAADTVKVVVMNTTGAAIDLAAEQWQILVVQ